MVGYDTGESGCWFHDDELTDCNECSTMTGCDPVYALCGAAQTGG